MKKSNRSWLCLLWLILPLSVLAFDFWHSLRREQAFEQRKYISVPLDEVSPMYRVESVTPAKWRDRDMAWVQLRTGAVFVGEDTRVVRVWLDKSEADRLAVGDTVVGRFQFDVRVPEAR